MKGSGMVRAIWEDYEGWTEIHLEQKWKEMMKRVYEIPAPKDNGGLPRYLMVAVSKKKNY